MGVNLRRNNMITCPNCNKQLEDGTKFCDNCGKQIIETIFCQNCGKETSTEFAFCQNCGASLSDEAIVSDNGKKKKFALPKRPFKISKKLIAIGSACIALVLVAAIVLSTLFSGGGSNNFALYLKDGEVYFTNISKIEPWQVTTRLIDDDSIDNDDLADSAYTLGYYTHLSNDGKILFYVDKITEDSAGASLFYRYVNKPKQEPVKIDSDVASYSVSENGKLVTYLKGEEGILYQHNLTDKEKIDSEVSAFEVSDDGKKIGYLNKEGGMYLKYAGKDKEKLDSEVSRISYINEDFNTVYYIKEDSLYKKVEGKDKEKIASDISSVIKVYESGEIYYLKSNSSNINLIDYVEDDLKEADAAMTLPQTPEYPSYWDYDDYDDYQAATDRYHEAYEEYQIAKQAWNGKLERDAIREDLAEAKMPDFSGTLYYYDGKVEKVLTDAYAYDTFGFANNTIAEDNPVIIFSIYNQSSITKVKLSEIDYVSEVEDMVEAALYSSSEKYIAIKDSSSVIEQTEAKNFNITSDGKTVYFLDDVSEESYHGDVYKMSISGNEVSKTELYDSDVYPSFSLTNNGQIVYFKDVKASKGELYVDKQKIDYDVNLYNFTYLDESDAVVYMVDWNDEKDYGTLKTFKNGKAIKIADDVHSYNTTPNGEILYLYDYSTNYNKGELFIYKNNKAEKIDDDVVAIIPTYDLKYRGETYNGW